MYFIQFIVTYFIVYGLVVSICFPDPNEERKNRFLVEAFSVLATYITVESFERISDLGEVLGHGLN